jgi:hypothetical protein
MSRRLTEVIKEVDALSPEEQRSLLAHLAERQRAATSPGPSPLRRQDLRGCAPGLVGGDARDRVSESRRNDPRRRVGTARDRRPCALGDFTMRDRRNWTCTIEAR